jgi:glucan phosphoethanolaminetransferase (alkaline phosphatase superfamily)
MAKPNTSEQEAPVQAAPAQPQYYQQAYAPAPVKQATHPALELGLAVTSTLASAWLFVGAVSGAIGLFGGRTGSYDGITSFFVSHLSSYTGVIVSSLLAVMFALAALLLFRRTRDAIVSDDYKAVLQAGAAIAVIKAGILTTTTIAVGLTPLLTIQKGSKVGSVYLYDFLPLALAAALFVVVAWYMIKLVGKQRVATLLSSILLIATSLVFLLGFVAVIIKSHSKSSSYTPTTSDYDFRSDDSSSSTKKSSDSSSKSTDSTKKITSSSSTF